MRKPRTLCPTCGSIKRNLDCPDCLQKQSTRERYRAEGLCVKCGSLPIPGMKHCEDCLEKLAEKNELKKPPQTILPPHLRALRRKARRQLKAKKVDDPGADPSR